MRELNKLNLFVKKVNLILIGIIYLSLFSFAQENKQIEEKSDLRIVFYNCENLFDTIDDPLKNDAEFLPGGDKHWNKYKYRDKLNNIYKVIIAVGGWTPPQIIGLCEVENHLVLDDLVKKTPISRLNYKVVHYESPDKRGIDVALLYQEEHFQLLQSKPIPIYFPGEPGHKTRDILYAKGKLQNDDSLHVFVNHWSSRWGGQLETESYRMFVASVLRKQVDSILGIEEQANILIMGDLNDEPLDKSLMESLKTKNEYESLNYGDLYNLSSFLKNTLDFGSHKYKNEWGILDQIIVSGNLLDSVSGIFTSQHDCHIFKPGFLIEPDETYLGEKPFRTYTGFRYNGGFSDHLPVYLDMYFGKK